jgi:S1-C subfamily serine protease
MGAAIVGTLLGGLAVYLALRYPDLSLAGAVGAEAPAPAAAVAPGAAAAATRGDGEDPDPAAAAHASSPVEARPVTMADAVAQTMPSVVSVRVSGSVHGAGVIYDERGLILTNYHVVGSTLRSASRTRIETDTDSITVQFANGRELPARVVAADADEDIAVLRLSPADSAEVFPAAEIGVSSNLRVGEEVFAVGSPVGLQHTVSSGIVSAIDRTDILPKRQLPLVQLDASINVGNSGGPLFNRAGELVGITVARSHRAQGIGFAIPIDHVSAVLRALQKGESERAGVIGIQLAATDAVAPRLAGIDYTTGLIVEEVFDGPAKNAGLRKGDVVVEIRGKRYDELGDDPKGRAEFLRHFGQVVRSVVPGETLPLTVVRDGETVQVEVEVAAADDSRQARIDCEELLGLHLDEDSEIPTVERVVSSSVVGGLRGTEVLAGAEITHVLGQSVASVTELGKALADIRGWARSGHGRTIALSFRAKNGKPFRVPSFPLNAGS